ncbi:MAG: FtsX-like permease family protein [Clostridiales Family XIII bacterium]|jgi:putative ABC transport system permease protein|nr:FtsX-like permease family protein [Clostridiales Family XIII bacterium]
MKTIDKRLFRMISDTKGQFIAVSVVLAVGLIFFMSMRVSAVNMTQGMNAFYDEFSFADLTCELEQVSSRQIREIEGISGIAAAEGRVTGTVPLLNEDGDERARVKIITYNHKTSSINRLMLEDGAWPVEGRREILAIRQLAEARGIETGDDIELQLGGQGMEFYVSGIVSSPEFVYLLDPDQGILPDNKNYGIVYMDESLGQSILGLPGGYNEILMLEEAGLSAEKRGEMVDKLEKELDRYGSRGIVKKENQVSNLMMKDEINQLNSMAAALPAIFLLIAAMILAMMLGRMVKKDKQPIGVMKGLGYSSAQVIMHYVKYTLLVAAAGSAVGSLVGMRLAGFMTAYYMEFFNLPDLGRGLDYRYIFAVVLIACGFCVAAGLAGTRGVVRVSPAESMTVDSPKAGKKIFLEHVKIIWNHLSFSDKMAVKNVFRNKKRTLFILMGVTVTFGMTAFVVCMPSMMSDMMGDGLREFQPMDYNISFRNTVSEKALNEISHIVDDVQEIEGKIEYPFKLSSGNHEITLTLIGVEKDTVFYNFKDQEGIRRDIPEDGLLVSDYAARKLKVGIGDKVLMHSYLSDNEDKWMEVQGIVYQAMGVNAYMDKDALAAEYLAPGMINGFFMNCGDPETVSKLKEWPAVTAVSSIVSITDTFQEYTQMMNVMIFFMLILSGVLGFAIVYNATIISIGERETEFSSLRVLGFSRGEIFRLILRENNMITIGGLAAGIPVANILLRYSSEVFSTEQYTMHLRAGLLNYAEGFAATVLFIILAQIATYRKIQKLDFMAALKNRA